MGSSERAPELLGGSRFELGRTLGAGGMGVVYEAHDRVLDEAVALKTLHHIGGDAIYRLKKEFRVLVEIQHPGLVTLGELFEEGGRYFFSMELVRGVDPGTWVRGLPMAPVDSTELTMERVDGVADAPTIDRADLAKALSETGATPRPDEERLRDLMLQITRALRTLHSHGKIHRDLKPSNVLVTEEGRAVVLDFGLATDVAKQSIDGRVVGTVAYMAPEQATGRAITEAADWYALGILLYELLTGEPPFTGTVVQVLGQKQVRDAPRPTIDGPADLIDLAMDLLERDPEQRPSGDEVLFRLGGELERGTRIDGSARHVGRDRPMSVLADARERSTEHAVLALVRGEGGVGKSHLVQHALREWSDDEELVLLRGRCWERENVPFKAFDGVADDLARTLAAAPESVRSELFESIAALARAFPVLHRVIDGTPKTTPGDDAGLVRARTFAAMRTLLGKLAERAPLVIVIDDLQWADEDSRRLLEELIRPPDAPPITWLLTSRADAVPEWMESLVDRGLDLVDIPLGTLERSAAEGLARELLEATGQSTALAAALARESDGHPLFLRELVLAAGDSNDEPALTRLEDAIGRRIDRLPELDRRVALQVAVAGLPIELDVLRKAIGEPVTLPVLTRLEAAHVIRTAGGHRTVAPYHDRVREALLTGLGEEERVALHARLADALIEHPLGSQRPEMVLMHLRASDRMEHAARHAVDAADQAFRVLAFDRAAELYELALATDSHEPKERARLVLRRAEALASSGNALAAAEAFEEAAVVLEERPERLDCLSRAASLRFVSGDIDSGYATLGAVLDELGESFPHTTGQALRSLLWHRFRLALRGRKWEHREPEAIDPSVLLRVDVMQRVGFTLGLVDNVRGAVFQARALRLALEAGEARRLGLCLVIEALYRASQGEKGRREARALLDEARMIYERTGNAEAIAGLPGAEGILQLLAGRFVTSAEQSQAAIEAILAHRTATGHSETLHTQRIYRSMALMNAGYLADLRELYFTLMREAGQRGDRYVTSTLPLLAVRCFIASGEPELAAEELAGATWTDPADGFHTQHLLRALAEVDLTLARGEDARAKLQELEPTFGMAKKAHYRRVEFHRVNEDHARVRLALASGDRAHAEAMAKRLAGETIEIAHAYARLAAASLAEADGDTERAAQLLVEAAALAETAEAHLHAAAARHRRGRLIGGSTGDELVARAERFMTEQGITEIDTMVRVLAPALGERQP